MATNKTKSAVAKTPAQGPAPEVDQAQMSDPAPGDETASETPSDDETTGADTSSEVQGGDPAETDKAPEDKTDDKDAAAGKGKKTSPPKKGAPAPQAVKDDPFTKLAKEYSKLYPANKIFHITSDRQVFLDKNKGLAEAHQRTLEGGAVTSITV